MDIIGSREIAERFQISQEQARILLRSKSFESLIELPGTGKRKIIRTTRRAMLKKLQTHGYPLSPEELAYLEKLEGNQTAPIGSDKGQQAGRVELSQPVV